MASATIECELRALLDESKYQGLKAYLMKEADFGGEDEQITTYYDAPVDLRIQRGNAHAKVWLKKGAMHSDAREEIELRVPKEEYGTLELLFGALGYKPNIMWWRKRLSFVWNGFDVALDHTIGFGYVLEVERRCDEADRAATVIAIRDAMETLGIRPTPKPVLNERFEYYKANWKALTEKEKMPA